MESVRAVKFLGFVLCVLLICAVPTEGVVIPLENSGWAMVVSPTSRGVSMPVVEWFDDNVVVIQLGKTFDRPPENGLLHPLIIEFQKTSADASANIVIRDEYIVNDTGVEWLDFHMYLLVDIFEPQAGFNPNFIPDGGQLEEVNYSGNYGYNGLPVQLHFIDTNGSGVPASPPGDDVFWPGYVSGQVVIATDPGMQVGARFGLKEIPTVPEPATLLLLGMGTLMALTKRKSLLGRFRTAV